MSQSQSRYITLMSDTSRIRDRERYKDLTQSDIYKKNRSDRSRSPIRYKESEEKSSKIDYNEDYYKPSKEIYEITPMTLGIEYEPSNIQYNDNSRKKHYDREIIYRTDDEKLRITIEEFDVYSSKKYDYYSEEDKNLLNQISCKYNIELDIGVFEFPTIRNFLEQSENYINFFNPIIDNFKEYIRKDNTEFLRLWSKSPISGQDNFKNCSKSILPQDYTYGHLDIFYNDIFDIENNIKGRPQLTLGLSYAFLPLLAYNIEDKYPILEKSLKLYNNFIKKFKPNFLGLKQSSIDVFKGFIFLILYTSNNITTYVSKSAGGNSSYLKSIFPLKPRTNLAMSHIYLLKDYPDLENKLEILRDNIQSIIDEKRNSLQKLFKTVITPFEYKGIVVSTEDKDMVALDDFLKYKMYIITILSESDILLRKILEKSKTYDYNCQDCDDTVKLNLQIQHIIHFINIIDTGSQTNKIKKIIDYFSYLQTYILIFDILHPVPVVKVNILNKDRLGRNICYQSNKSSKILDNYVYSYIEGKDRDNIDILVSEKLISISEPYPYSGQPPLLFPVKKMGRTYICTNFREELFEWVKETSNVIIEIRGPEKLTLDEKYHKKNISIKLDEFQNFFEEVLIGLNDALD